MSKKNRLAEIVTQLRMFRFCGPGDDPDELTNVTAGYRHLLIQLKRLATPVLPEAESARLNGLDVKFDDIYSVYEAAAEVDALLPDIEAVLEQSNESSFSVGANVWVVEPGLIERLASTHSARCDVAFLARVCQEINSSFAHRNIVATVLLMRAVLNHVPPAFGQDTFAQVAANVGRSLKDSFEHLENGLRKIADFHTHRRIGASAMYPSPAQVEPFKPQFELLLQQVVAVAEAE